MQLSLMRNDTIYRVPLPAKVGGQVWVTLDASDREDSRLVSVEGVGGEWVLKSTRRAWIQEGSRRTREATLGPNRFYEVVVGATGEQVLLRCEPTTDDRRRYTRFALPKSTRLRVGRAADCHIRYESGFISTHHADLVVSGDSVTVEDQGSANGTFVNARRVTRQTLRPGDVVSLFGLTIVAGSGFVAVNDPDGLVVCDSRVRTQAPRAAAEGARRPGDGGGERGDPVLPLAALQAGHQDGGVHHRPAAAADEPGRDAACRWSSGRR